jgi:hypothetical protein
MCHCLECQRRTGAVIGNLARFRREQITFNGTAKAWKRTGESGNTLTCYFCPTCGSTVYFENEAFPGIVGVAIGNFADPNFPAPTRGDHLTHLRPAWVMGGALGGCENGGRGRANEIEHQPHAMSQASDLTIFRASWINNRSRRRCSLASTVKWPCR